MSVAMSGGALRRIARSFGSLRPSDPTPDDPRPKRTRVLNAAWDCVLHPLLKLTSTFLSAFGMLCLFAWWHLRPADLPLSANDADVLRQSVKYMILIAAYLALFRFSFAPRLLWGRSKERELAAWSRARLATFHRERAR